MGEGGGVGSIVGYILAGDRRAINRKGILGKPKASRQAGRQAGPVQSSPGQEGRVAINESISQKSMR